LPTPITGFVTSSSTAYTFTTTTAVATTSAQPTPPRTVPANFSSNFYHLHSVSTLPFL
jgi:hypothetical protein